MKRLLPLECGRCGEKHDAFRLQTVCSRCGAPLLVRYDVETPGLPSLEEVCSRPRGQFRFPEMLPLSTGGETPTLGEGATPLLAGEGLGASLGLPRLRVKDEAQNPTGSFKARGMAVALAWARQHGVEAVCLPSAGNAGAAASAYGALHGIEVHVAIPANTPEAIARECQMLGARVQRVEGTISEAGKWIAERAPRAGWFNLATLREPGRIEGKKMMGYELYWEMGRVPDVIFYPTGGGTGLIGMAKAFDEMQALGWIGSERPRFVSVQLAGCDPIVRAFEAGKRACEACEDPPETAAFGLRVPKALGDFLILEALQKTRGCAVAVTEEEIAAGCERMARHLGIWPCPEGGACVAAAAKLGARDWLAHDDLVVLFNTGSPLNYAGAPA
ncbi:MAG: threonine synthase [Planctomycetota bacterium]